MRADEASGANKRKYLFSCHSQNAAIIAEPTGKIKGGARLPALLWPPPLTRVRSTVTLPVVHPPHRSQAKAGTNAPPQSAFILDTDQCFEPFPGRI